ncbi:MAG: alpha/beta hydrolase [Pyrinomonadaceae bacterium]
MKKRNILFGAVGAVSTGIAVKMLTRKKTVNYDDVAATLPHAENSHLTEVDGVTIHYQEFGDPADPTLLLIHGYTASSYVWDESAPLLSENGFRVIAVDMPGFGYSDKPAWFDYSITSQARVLSRFMNRIGIGRATVVGSSYGGAVAATLALDYPERVEKLVLVSAVCNDAPKEHPILRLASIPGIGELITPFLISSRTFLRHRMYKTLAPANHHMIDQDRIGNIHRPLNAADAHHSILATSRNWHANRIERDANLIEQPTLIIWGEDDRVIPIEDGHSLHSSILHSRLVVLKDCGHVPQEEKSNLFSEIVTEFCRDRRGHIGPHGDEMRIEPES